MESGSQSKKTSKPSYHTRSSSLSLTCQVLLAWIFSCNRSVDTTTTGFSLPLADCVRQLHTWPSTKRMGWCWCQCGLGLLSFLFSSQMESIWQCGQLKSCGQDLTLCVGPELPVDAFGGGRALILFWSKWISESLI